MTPPAYDGHKNYSYSTVATAPSPAASGTSLVVTAGHGVRFPTAPFAATVWPAGVQPKPANAEIVLVTARATDTFTITRAQESSSARTIIVGDQIIAKAVRTIGGAGTTGPTGATGPTGVTGVTGATGASPTSNPYKFRVSRNAAANTGNAAFAVIAFDTEQVDTSNNVASGVFTAPVAGFYLFSACCGVGVTAGDLLILSLFKNGAEVARGAQLSIAATVGHSVGVTDLMQLGIGDTVDTRVYCSTARALSVGNTNGNYFTGHLVSLT